MGDFRSLIALGFIGYMRVDLVYPWAQAPFCCTLCSEKIRLKELVVQMSKCLKFGTDFTEN